MALNLPKLLDFQVRNHVGGIVTLISYILELPPTQ